MATSAGESVLFVGTRFSNLYTAVDTASVYDSICQIGSLLPDVDIAAQVGKDFFLDEKIPRHESGQGYV